LWIFVEESIVDEIFVRSIVDERDHSGGKKIGFLLKAYTVDELIVDFYQGRYNR